MTYVLIPSLIYYDTEGYHWPMPVFLSVLAKAENETRGKVNN